MLANFTLQKRNFVSLIMRSSIFTLVLFLSLAFLRTNIRAQQTDADRVLSEFHLYQSVFFNYHAFLFSSPTHADRFHLFLQVSLVNDLLQFVNEGPNRYRARFELSVMIQDSSQNLVASETVQKQLIAKTFAETNSRSIFHHYYQIFSLPPGKYELILILVDLDTRKSLKRDRSIEIPKCSGNTIRVLPPVVFMQGEKRPLQPLRESINQTLPVFFDTTLNLILPFTMNQEDYFRLNRSGKVVWEILRANSPAPLSARYRLLNAENEELWHRDTLFVAGKNSIHNLSVTLRPESYVPGYYVLQLQLTQGDLKRNTQANFYFSLPPRPPDPTDSFEDEFGALQYIVDESVYREWQNLSFEAREVAVDTFWSNRNPEKNTNPNPLRQEFKRRIQFANQNFVSLVKNRKGWETDQGRIYLIYGPPTEILHPRSPNSQYQHEIWIYSNRPRELRFIFVFKQEEGEYILMRRE